MRRSYQQQGTPLDDELTNCSGPYLEDDAGTGTRAGVETVGQRVVGLWDCRIPIGLRHGRHRTVAFFMAPRWVLLRYVPMEDSGVSNDVGGSYNSSNYVQALRVRWRGEIAHFTDPFAYAHV